jgi:hypothetical protein
MSRTPTTKAKTRTKAPATKKTVAKKKTAKRAKNTQAKVKGYTKDGLTYAKGLRD